MSQLTKFTVSSGPGSGTVTSISQGTGITLTPNPITTVGTVALTIPVVVTSGGTGAITLTNHGVLLGQGTNPVVATAVGTTGQVLTGVTGADPVWASPASSSISITGDSGGALIGNAFTFTGGTTGLTFSGAVSTETLTGTLVVANGGTGATTLTGILIGNGTSPVTANAVTQYNVLVGGASNAITSIAPSATSGIPLISQGAASNPVFGTAVVAGGGTGATTLTNHGVLLGQGTSAVVATAVGTTGQVLTGVTGGDPVWASPASSSISITGDTGGALVGTAFTFTGGTTGLSFGGSGSTQTLTFAGITANAGVVALGTDSVNNAINIGTATSAGRVITIGNTTGTTSIAENVGSGGYTLTGAAASPVTIGASVSSANITLGGSLTSGNLNIANGAGFAANLRIAANNNGGQITIGSTTGASGIGENVGTGNYVLSGAAGSTITIGSGITTGTTLIGGTAQTGTITLGSSSGTNIVAVGAGAGATTVNIANGATNGKTVNIATGAVANTVIVGSTTGASALTLNSGSAGIIATGVASVAVANKNYVTINTSTGALGSDSGSAGVTWTEVTAATQALAINSGYIMNRATAITATLPSTAALGSIIEIAGKGAGLTIIAQNSGQTIHFGSSNTTTGVTGTLTATNQYDCLRMLCTTANTDFVVLSSMGNWTVV